MVPAALAALWWGVGGGENAVFALAGAGVSLVGTVLLALRLRTLRGRRPRAAGGLMAVNAASRMALAAAGLLLLLPYLSTATAALYLAGFFVSQALLSAAILSPKG